MASMDATIARGTALPPIAHINLDQNKKEDMDNASRRISSTSGASVVSPTFPYSGPTPPYSHPPSTASAYTSPRVSMASPPSSNRTLKDEPNVSARQSLPSISEALGGASVNRLPAPASLAGPTIPLSAPTTRRFTPPTMSSEQAPHPLDRYDSDARSHTQPALHGQYSTPRSAGAQHISSIIDKLPALQPHATGLSPPSHIRANVSVPPSSLDPLPSRHSSVYGTSKPHADPAFARPILAPSTTPSYPSSSPYNHSTYQPQWRSDTFEDSKAGALKPPRPRYDEIVKRELATYDIQGSLNEFGDYGKQLVEFAHYFSDASRQAHRAGHPHIPLPSPTDLDILLVRSSRLQELLVVMKDMAVMQSAAAKRPASPVHSAKRPLEDDRVTGNGSQQDEGKSGGFAGGEPKKRRGRAAPPGRCHSCNRAETPEWRRGPDGARTLCNACGLHYAKLTRKMNQSNKTGSMSNLNPASTGSVVHTKDEDSS